MLLRPLGGGGSCVFPSPREKLSLPLKLCLIMFPTHIKGLLFGSDWRFSSLVLQPSDTRAQVSAGLSLLLTAPIVQRSLPVCLQLPHWPSSPHLAPVSLPGSFHNKICYLILRPAKSWLQSLHFLRDTSRCFRESPRAATACFSSPR